MLSDTFIGYIYLFICHLVFALFVITQQKGLALCPSYLLITTNQKTPAESNGWLPAGGSPRRIRTRRQIIRTRSRARWIIPNLLTSRATRRPAGCPAYLNMPHGESVLDGICRNCSWQTIRGSVAQAGLPAGSPLHYTATPDLPAPCRVPSPSDSMWPDALCLYKAGI